MEKLSVCYFKRIVRVGGGYLDLEVFLEVYGPGELLKSNKKEISIKKIK